MVLPLHLSESCMLTLIAVAICAASTFLLAVLRFLRRDPHVRGIPGPVYEASWLHGNLPELLLSQPYEQFVLKWQRQYGSTYRIKGCFSEDLLFTSDPATIRYILNDPILFDFPPSRRFLALMLFGEESILAQGTGGKGHRHIKNAFSPAFSPARLQLYVPFMRDISRKAVDKLMEQYLKSERNNSEEAVVDILDILQHVTSDIIGELAIGHNFNATETDGGDEIARSHRSVVILGSKRSKSAILGDSLLPRLPRPILKWIVTLPVQPFKTLLSFRHMTDEWATQLLRENLEDEDDKDAGLIGFVGTSSANKSKKRERLTFQEISRQTPTFLVAGQETTATAIGWAIYELAKSPAWQDQVRKEIMEAQDTTDSSLDKLKYLNAHIKESLRLHPAVPHTERMAFEDTVLPLSRPVTTDSGRVITQLPVRKGQTIYFGVASYNRNPSVWGSDADTFDPLRWLDGRCDSQNLQGSIGPYSNLATFAGGSRTCIGWRLAVLEMQVVLLELILRFRFKINPEQAREITSCFALTLLPVKVESGKSSLSLLVQPI